MPHPPASESISADSPPLAAAPFGTEEGRAFLQQRVAMFARIQGLLSLGFLLFDLVTVLTAFRHLPLAKTFLNVPHAFHFAAAACALAIWLVARRGRIEPGRLVWLDLGATVSPMVGYAAMAIAAYPSRPDRYDLVVMLIAMLVLTLRATLVPSRTKVTAAISSAACLPVLVVAAVLGPVHAPSIPRYLPVLMLGVWCAAATFAATLATHVIYGLRRKAAKAEQLGQYVLDQKIGEGGMGTVYRARHALLRRPTAIKLLPAEKAGRQAISRFAREVRQTSRLTHPNTVAIYDYGHTPDGVFYYAMELLEGLDIQELVDGYGPQPPARVIHVLSQVCGSLEEAHGIGLVHRDIKPANIILCQRGGIPDTAKVVDFGLVKSVEQDPSLTVTSENAILGTPLYLPPEAIRSPDAVDGRADLYALAAVGYFMLVGKPVFEGESVVEVCGKHLHETPVAPSQKAGRALPPDLEQVLLTCLAKEPDGRPQSARALKEALAACDVPAWTEQQAKAWWSEHGAARPRPRGLEATSSVSATVVMVDFDEPRAAG